MYERDEIMNAKSKPKAFRSPDKDDQSCDSSHACSTSKANQQRDESCAGDQTIEDEREKALSSHEQNKIDEASRESFPASDPPARY